MIKPIFNIAQNTFVESIRQPIFLVVLGIGIVLLILELFFAAYTFDNDDKLLIEFCLSTIFLGGVAMSALIATGVLYREIDNKTVLTVISKPIGRPAFIFGKYLGVVAAVFVAFWVWSLVTLMLIRHEVMSTGGDHADQPVITAGVVALLLAIAIATWGNYFYNWVFTSRLVGLFVVLLTLGYLLVLVIDKNWNFQPIWAEFYKEDLEGRAVLSQVIVALFLVLAGMTTLCAVAIACSTRLGIVLTLIICLGIFLIGSFAEWAFDRYADEGHATAWVAQTVTPHVGVWFAADALAQNSKLTAGYVWTVLAYTLCMTGAALFTAVALFQTRQTS